MLAVREECLLITSDAGAAYSPGPSHRARVRQRIVRAATDFLALQESEKDMAEQDAAIKYQSTKLIPFPKRHKRH